MNGLRPLYKWFRFIIYLFIFYILYKTFENLLTTPDPPTPLSYNNNNNNNNNKYNNLVLPEKLDKNASPPPSFKKKDKEDQRTSFMPLYRDFPWYKQPHNRFLFKGEASTIDLSLQQRQQLQYDLIDKAKQQTRKSLASIGYISLGIPGTNIQTDQQIKVLREKIACWTQGSWQPVKKSKQQLLNHVQDPLYTTCDKIFYKKNKDPQLVRPETQYQWVPSSSSICPLQYHATPDQWCSFLNGRHILLVGDLLQYQLHEVFLDTLRDGPTVCFGELNCKDHTLCSKPDTRLRYLRNDILLNNPKHVQNNGQPTGSIITWPFVASNILKAYPILILNRSPIIESDEDFITSLIRTMAHIRKTTPETLIIYRSSPIGHPYCNDASAPLTQPLTEEEWKRLPYGWSELERRNQIAKSIVEEAGGIFIDLATLVNVRPDGHVGNQDCIRYCIPGPLDSWMDVLYQLFKELAI